MKNNKRKEVYNSIIQNNLSKTDLIEKYLFLPIVVWVLQHQITKFFKKPLICLLVIGNNDIKLKPATFNSNQKIEKTLIGAIILTHKTN